MGDRQRLRITLRSRTTRQEFAPVQVVADPEDLDQLQRELHELARDQDGRQHHGFPWAHEYELLVEHLDRPWLTDFRLPGSDA